MLRRSIQRMYEEIVSYEGDFGDPIADFVDFEPLTVLKSSEVEESVRQGAAIALLVNFSVALDNTDYVSALKSNAFLEIDMALARGLLKEFPSIETTARQASNGEREFYRSLRVVYVTYVKEAAQAE